MRKQKQVVEDDARRCCSHCLNCTAPLRQSTVTTRTTTAEGGPSPPLTVLLTRPNHNEDASYVSDISPLTLAPAAFLSSSEDNSSATLTADASSGPKGKRTRKSPRQASEARLDEKQARDSLNERYSKAFKEATTLISSKSGAKNKMTTAQVITQMNEEYNLNGTTKVLKRSTLYKAVSTGNVGNSPMRKGPPPKIPRELLEVVATHAEVCQAGDCGELRGREIKRLIGAAVLGTEFDNKFKVQSVWKKVRREFPEKLQAASKLSVDDARGQWTTQNNLQQWFDDAKRDLIQTGLVIDREVRCSVTGDLISEVDFRSDEVRRRIINMDETHHDLSITGDRGGPRSVVYHNPKLQRGSQRGVKSSRHVTGVYATNAAGEALPPMYIFDSCATIDENFRVRLQWLDGLPNITGRFGCPTRIESSSFYSVRSRGSMDDSLLNDYIDKVLLPLYPNISKRASFDAVTGKSAPCFESFETSLTLIIVHATSGKLLCGPVVFKLDSGPGRIVASLDSILKREEYLEMGLIILSGLPNSTSVQQEMDALYGPFKSATYDRAEYVLMEKIKERGIMRQAGGAAAANILSLGFEDLATIVDGTDNDDVSMKPFTKTFTRDKILRTWAKIGFVPFTRNCLNDKKVRHELGQAHINVDIENLHGNYVDLVAAAENHGLNQGIFDATLPVAIRLGRVVDEDQQVRQLLTQKGAFSASALWNVCGTRVGNARVVLRAQREQIAIDTAKTMLLTQGRIERQAKLLFNAQIAREKYDALGIGALTDKDWGEVVRWVLPEAKVAALMRDLKKKDAIIAKLATLERDWTTYIPTRTPI